MPKVSVVISTYTKERANYVLDCISSLQKQSYRPEEILLVLDPDPELKLFYSSIVPNGVTLFSSPDRGLSNSRNTGLKAANGEVVAFIDDDATADENWLRSLVSNYDSKSVMGVCGFVVPVWENGRRPGWFPEELDWIVSCSYKGLPQEKSLVRNPIGCNMSFRKDVFGTVGYFKSDFGRVGRKLLDSEEREIAWRLLEKCPSWELIYDPTAVVYHKVPKSRQSLQHFIKRSFYDGLSKRMLERSAQTTAALSIEKEYLRYLLRTATLSRLRRVPQPHSFSQLLAIVLAISLVGTGYLVGNLIPTMPSSDTTEKN